MGEGGGDGKSGMITGRTEEDQLQSKDREITCLNKNEANVDPSGYPPVNTREVILKRQGERSKAQQAAAF